MTGLEPEDVTLTTPAQGPFLPRNDSALAAAKAAIIWLEGVEKEGWFTGLPQGRRRFSLAKMAIVEGAHGGPMKERNADLHVHFGHGREGCHLLGACTALAVAQVLRGKGFNGLNIGALGEVTACGKIPPPVLSDQALLWGVDAEIDVPSAHVFLCPSREWDGGRSMPKTWNQGLDVKALSDMREMIEYAYRAAKQKASK